MSFRPDTHSAIRPAAQGFERSLVVESTGIAACASMPALPRLDAAFGEFAPVFQGRYFVVFRRHAAGASPG